VRFAETVAMASFPTLSQKTRKDGARKVSQ
jgi:hypothetical protein